MKVSYLVFCYNHKRFIAAAIEAALAQTYPDMEIIIIDDGSTDGSVAEIERVLRLSRRDRVEFIRNQSNAGIQTTFNRAFAQADGDIIVWADGDDISDHRRVERIVAYFLTDPTLQLVSSNVEAIDDNGQPLGQRYQVPRGTDNLSRFKLPHFGLLGATLAFRTALFRQFGPLQFDVQIVDRVVPFWAAIAGRIGYIHDPLVLYRRHSASLFGFRQRFTSVAAWQEHQARRNAMMIPVLRNRLAALAIGDAIYPDRRPELADIRAATKAALAVAEAADRIYRRSTILSKITNTVRAFGFLPPGWRSKWGWTKQHFFPGRYLAKLQHDPAFGNEA